MNLTYTVKAKQNHKLESAMQRNSYRVFCCLVILHQSEFSALLESLIFKWVEVCLQAL